MNIFISSHDASHYKDSRQRIGIVGGGIAGLTSAYKLQHSHHVTLFEASTKLGGHAQTFDTPGGHRIDPYVMVVVPKIYHNFFALMDEIGFDRFQPARMRTVIHTHGRIIHRDPPTRLLHLIKELPTLLNPSNPSSLLHLANYARFLLCFQRDWKAGRFVEDEPVERLVEYYPQYRAIIESWAVPFSLLKGQVSVNIHELGRLMFGSIDFSALLNGSIQPLITKNGVDEYISALVEQTDVQFHIQCPVQAVKKTSEGFWVHTKIGKMFFDEVIVATSPLEAANFLQSWDDPLRSLLDNLKPLYEQQLILIHTDTSVMKGIDRHFWGTGAFNYDPERHDNTVTLYVPGFYGYDEEIFITYMRPYGLTPQSAQSEEGWRIVPREYRLDPTRILDAALFSHPLWGSKSQRERFRALSAWSGTDGLYFCGVGLTPDITVGHEGAVTSALHTVQKLLQFLG